MNLKIAQKVLGLFIRVFIVILCFVMDVKVKADVVVESTSGRVEFENNHEILSPKGVFPFKISDTHELDIQTFENGSARMKLDDKIVGIAPGSLFTVSKDGTSQFAKGRIFFSFSRRSSPLHIQTPQGLIKSDGGDILLEVTGGKTQVSVIKGYASLVDRASKKEVNLDPGYSFWLGGLLSTGAHAHPVRPEACDLEKIMDDLKPIMGWSEKEFQSRYDAAKPHWKDAVMKVAEDAQSALDSDIRILNRILANERRFEEKRNREQAKLRQLFREKTTGLPGENPESPSESGRAPSSDFE